MRGLEVPERTEDFTADPVELFFDLAFVFAFSQLVYHLIHHPTWQGAGEAGLLFLILWLGWSVFSWAANAVSGNAREVRFIFLIATATSVPMGASVSTAFGSGGGTFAVCAAIIMLMALALQMLSFDRSSTEFQWLVGFGVPTAASLALLVIGGFINGDARVVLWILSVVVMIGALILTGVEEWMVRAGHFAERHGLIIIIALGEVIVAIGISVVRSLDDTDGLPTDTMMGLVAAGVMAGLLWWSYFDRVLPALEHGLDAQQAKTRGIFARDVYTVAHIPIVAGVITTAAAAEEVLLHPNDVHLEFRVMFAAGLLLFFGGISAAVFRAFKVVAKERLAAMAALAVVTLAFNSINGIVLLVIVDVLILLALVAEHARIEHDN